MLLTRGVHFEAKKQLGLLKLLSLVPAYYRSVGVEQLILFSLLSKSLTLVSGLVNCSSIHLSPWTLLLILLTLHAIAENDDSLFCHFLDNTYYTQHCSDLFFLSNFMSSRVDLCH